MIKSKCHYLLRAGPQKGSTCDKKVSKLDPEGLYCNEHRVCTWIVKEDKQVPKPKERVKYADYITFCVSLLEDGEKLFKAK